MGAIMARDDRDAYTPVAVYYADADSLEYVRRDEPAVYRRVDGLLTLILSMATREPLGFQLKGFRHFYLQHLRHGLESGDENFSKLIYVLEEATRLAGDRIFSETERQQAYMKARDIAEQDSVTFSEIFSVA